MARFVLERLPGRIVFETTPAAVRVFVDGAERGTTDARTDETAVRVAVTRVAVTRETVRNGSTGSRWSGETVATAT